MESKGLRKMASATPEARLRRIQKGCGIIEKVLVALIILLGIHLFQLIDMALSEEKLNLLMGVTFGNGENSGMLGNMGIVQFSEESAREAFRRYILWSVFETAFVIAFFILVCNIASATKNSGTPFLLKNARRLQLAGWVLLALAVLSPLMQRIALASGFEMVGTAGLNPVEILVGGILLVLAKIFEYGCMLQQEYDETL